MQDWKGKVTVYKKDRSAEPDNNKVSTKRCRICRNDRLLLLSTLNRKNCTDCYIDIPWYLEQQQQPLFG